MAEAAKPVVNEAVSPLPMAPSITALPTGTRAKKDNPFTPLLKAALRAKVPDPTYTTSKEPWFLGEGVQAKDAEQATDFQKSIHRAAKWLNVSAKVKLVARDGGQVSVYFALTPVRRVRGG